MMIDGMDLKLTARQAITIHVTAKDEFHKNLKMARFFAQGEDSPNPTLATISLGGLFAAAARSFYLEALDWVLIGKQIEAQYPDLEPGEWSLR